MRPTTSLAALVLAAGLVCPAHAAVVYDLIAYTSEPAPDIPSVVFTNLEAFSANASGKTALSATLFGVGVLPINEQGIWTGLPGALSLYAREQDSAPGLPPTPQIYYGPFSAVGINAAGQIVFNDQLAGGVLSFNDDSIWAGAPNAIQKIARAGDAAPGAGAAQFGSFGSAVINGSANVAFDATLAAGAVIGLNDLGIWSGTAGAVQLVARSNDHAPGTSPSTVHFGSFKEPVLGDTGALAFFATLANAAPFQDTGIWYGASAAQLQLLARRNQSAPGTTGPWFDVFGDPIINNAGIVCFAATLQGTGATALSSNGVWAGTPGNLNLIARAGNPAPGLPVGDNFLSFAPPIFNDAGQFAFVATLVGPGIGVGVNDSAVYAGPPGNLKLIAQTHGQAPGLQTGTLFKSFDKILMDASGRVAIFAKLQGGVDPNFDAGIWAVDSTDQLQLVIWEGQRVDLPNATFVPFAANGLGMLGNRRTDFSVFGPNRIPFTATLLVSSAISPVTTGWFFGNIVPAGPVLSTTIAGDQVQISFSTTTGATYQLQFTDSLTPINWQPIPPNLTGTGGILVVNDPLPIGPAQRYYRVLAL